MPQKPTGPLIGRTQESQERMPKRPTQREVGTARREQASPNGASLSLTVKSPKLLRPIILRRVKKRTGRKRKEVKIREESVGKVAVKKNT